MTEKPSVPPIFNVPGVPMHHQSPPIHPIDQIQSKKALPEKKVTSLQLGAWITARAMLHQQSTAPLMLMETPKATIRGAVQIPVERPTIEWVERTRLAMEKEDVLYLVDDRLTDDIEAHVYWPEIGELIDVELELVDKATKLLNRGKSRLTAMRTLIKELDVNYVVARWILNLTERAMQEINLVTKAQILTGMQDDVEESHKDGDIRAKITARKNLATAAGHMKDTSSGGPGELVDVLRELAETFNKPKELE